MTDQAKAGWYQQGDRARYWDGAAWTEHFRPLLPPAPAVQPPPLGAPIPAGVDDVAGRSRTAALVMIGGAVAVAVGCFLPWIKATAPFVGTLTKSGVDNGGDGVIALALAAGLAAIALRSRDRAAPWAKAGAAVLIALLVALVMYEVGDISSRFADIEAESDLVTTSYGSGLILIGAGILAAGIGWVQMVRRPSRSSLR